MDVGSTTEDVRRARHPSSRARVIVVVAAALLAFLALWLVVWANGRPKAPGDQGTALGTPIRVDRPAPPFTRSLLMGSGSLGLRRYEGRVVVLNFWASTCPPCRKEVPELEELWRTYRSRGVRVLGVDYVDGPAAAVAFARSHGMTYPSVIDGNGRLGDDYGIFGLPTTFIIAPDGRIRFIVNGKLHLDTFTQALRSVLGPATSGSGAG